MLRYFYVLFCIELCFCTEYIDNADNVKLDRTVRSKTNKVNNRLTNTKGSRSVQFDVQKFLQNADEDAVEDESLYTYKNTKAEQRRLSSSYDDFGYLVDSNENNGQNNKQVDYFNIRGNDEEFNKRSSANKDANARHFNFHTMSFEDKDDAKTKNNQGKANANVLTNDPERKCGFRNMKMPFFSHDNTKPRRLKKRKMFCFNCHKTSTAATNENPFEAKSFDFNKDKTGIAQKYISKRAYDYLCPRCLKGLVSNFRKKNTKKTKTLSTKLYQKESKTSTIHKVKTRILPKDTLDGKLREGNYNLDYVRKKRDTFEMDKRLKELEEVEKRIDSVLITPPSFKIPMDLE